MGRKIIDDKPAFGPKRPTKKENSSKFSNNSSLKKLAQYIHSDEFCIKGYMKLIEEEINKSGGLKGFLKNNKDFVTEFRKIALKSKNPVSKQAPKKFPELGLTEQNLQKSYKKQIKIYDEIISSNKENYSEEDTTITGEDYNSET